jgi:drug/metabolite transporter (DMT)-like permease
VLWYKVLKKISISTAAILQLSVPPLAAFGGVLFLNESLSLRLAIASVLIFSGIYIKSKTV